MMLGSSTFAAFLVALAITALVMVTPSEARPPRAHRGHHGHGRHTRNTHTKEELERIEKLKKDLLERMQLTEVPQVPEIDWTDPKNIENYRAAERLYEQALREDEGEMYHLYEHDDEDLYPKHFHSFNAHSMGVWSSFEEPEVLRVKVPVDVPEPVAGTDELRVSSATLHLYRLATQPWNKKESRTVGDEVQINVYMLLESMESTHSKPHRKLVDSRMVSLNHSEGGWELFDIKKAASEWLEDPASNFGLEISCEGDQSISDIISFVLDSNPSDEFDFNPHVSVYTLDIPTIRNKRSIDDKNPECSEEYEEHNTCCGRKKIEVDFKALGWNHVLKPQKMAAFYCDGTCPDSYKHAHHFASIKSLLHIKDRTTPPLKCTATKLSSQSMMILDTNGTYIVTKYEGMRVEECRCA